MYLYIYIYIYIGHHSDSGARGPQHRVRVARAPKLIPSLKNTENQKTKKHILVCLINNL